jgi:2-amino-4-hydroxy-6-hydroxymethyldihydropteridine diphosphokinase
MQWTPAYVGVGSNLEEPASQVLRALSALRDLPHTRLERSSGLYGSKPFGPVAQPPFVNAVAALLTRLEVREFFDALRTLESQLGRGPRRQRWGPRIIDLDFLLFGQQRLDSAELTLPHPGIVQRNFVLYPLREVAPELRVPGSGSVKLLAERVESAGIWRCEQ